MKTARRFFAAAILSSMLAAPAFADVPAQLTHQGRLLTDAGDPVTGSADLTFTLYDGATGGTTLWSETITADLGSDGFYAVDLGGTANPIDPLVLDAAEVWLGLAIDGGAELSPRLRVNSVPFAVVANQALGVADGSITTASVADGAITSTQLADIPWQKLTNVPAGVGDGDDDTLAGLMCATGEIAEWNGAAWACGARYTDAEAIAAVGAHYTDADAIAAVGAHYTDAQAIAAMGNIANTNPLHHNRYTNANAVSAMGAIANTNPLNHNRYTNANAVAAVAAANAYALSNQTCPAGESVQGVSAAGAIVCGPTERTIYHKLMTADWLSNNIVRSTFPGARTVTKVGETLEISSNALTNDKIFSYEFLPAGSTLTTKHYHIEMKAFVNRLGGTVDNDLLLAISDGTHFVGIQKADENNANAAWAIYGNDGDQYSGTTTALTGDSGARNKLFFADITVEGGNSTHVVAGIQNAAVRPAVLQTSTTQELDRGAAWSLVAFGNGGSEDYVIYSIEITVTEMTP